MAATLVSFPIRIDQMLFQEELIRDAKTNIPNQMALNTSASFIVCGISLLMKRIVPLKSNLHQLLDVLVLLATSFSLLGYLYQVPEFKTLFHYLPMAPITAICFLIFTFELLSATSHLPPVSVLTAGKNRKRVATFLAVAIILPVLTGYVRLLGHWRGALSTELGVTILVLVFILYFLLSSWIIVGVENSRDTLKVQTDKQLFDLNKTLITRNSDLATLNEELASSNEELVSGNEELQTINEQLAIANETINKQKDEQLNRVLYSSNDVIWSFDLTGGGKNYISRSAERIYGESLDALIQRPQFWLEHLHPDDREVKKASQRRLEAQGFTECTYRIALPGGIHWIHDRLRLINDKEGNPQRLDGIATDVTSIKEAERELGKERNLLRALIDNIPDYIFVRDDQFRSIINNRASVELLGASSEAETLGKTAVDYFGEKGRVLMDDDLRVFASGVAILNKEETVFVHGRPLTILATKIPLKDETGRITALIGIGRDITELKQQQQALWEHQENLDIIFNNSSGSFLLLNDEAEVILFNKAFEEFISSLAGIKPMAGMNFLDVVAPHRRADAQALYDRARNGEKVTTEAEFQGPNGIKIFHLLNYEPSLRNGKVTHVSISAIDITERRQKEILLKESEANLNSILQATLEGLMLLNSRYEIVMINDSYRSMVRNSSGLEARVGMSLFELIAPERKAGYQSFLDKVKAGEVVQYQTFNDKNSVKGWFNVTISRVTTDVGGFLGYCISAHDITNQKTAEIAIRASEERFRALVEGSVDLSSITDFQGGTSFVSANLPNILGYSNLDSGYGPILHPDDRALSKQRRALLEENPGKPFEFTIRLLHKDGSWRWMEGSTVNLTHVDSIKGIVSTYRDVTARKSMEESLQKTASSLAEFQNAIFRSSIVSIANRKGDITFVNDNFIKISGYSKEELVGQNHRIINSGYHPKAFWLDMWKTISRGEIWRNEVRNKAKDGTFYWVDTFVMPFTDADGTVREFVSIRNDITRRIKDEERIVSLNISLADFQKAINGSSIVSMADKRGTITFVNDNFIKISGYSREELVGQNHRLINSGHHPRAFWVEMWKTIAAGSPWRNEVKNKAKVGTFYWVETFIMPFLGDDGKIREFLSIRNDITTRKQIEDTLREYNDRYEIVSQATQDVIWDWDMAEDRVIYNHGMETVLGYKETEINLTSQWWKDKFHAEDHDRALLEMKDVFTNRLPNWNSNYRYRTASGNYKHIHDRAHVLYNNEGKPVRMIGAMQDVTEQTASLEEIKKLSLVASKTDNGVIITDAEGRIEWVNDGFVRLSGFGMEEVRGKYPQQLMEGPETDEKVANRMREKLKRQEPVTEELINYTKDMHKFWVRLTITPVLDETNHLKNFVTLLSNINEQKEYERSITLIAHELASLIEHANVPIFGIGQEGEIVEWNRVCADLSGYSREEAFNRDLLKRIIAPASRDTFNQMIEKVKLGASVSNLEVTIASKSGKRIILLMSASPGKAGDEGKSGVIIVAQDLTELSEYRLGLEKKVEERTDELKTALQKEKELVAMKSKFISIASHEFRTPLSSISLASGFIRKYKQRMSGEDIDRKLENIETQVHHMTYLLDDVLIIGKSEAGKLKANLSILHLRNFLNNLIHEVEQSTRNSHRIKVKMDSLPEHIKTDEKLMRNIVINLLTNAIKFSPGTGEIDVAVSGTENSVAITVRDFGIGIPAEDIDKLFESFYRAGNVAAIAGTGLGLSIVKKAVDLLGGQVQVNSVLTEGTEFTVTLPLSNG